MVTFSIIDELLGTPNVPPEHSATSLISRLLEVAAYEATESDINIQTCYSIVRVAREKREEIDTALRELTDIDSEEKAWKTFHQAIQDIRNLERLVLKAGVLKPANIDLESTTVQMAHTHLKTWEGRREKLGESHHHIVTFLAKPETIVKAAQHQDDTSLLQTLVGRIISGQESAINCQGLVDAHKALKAHLDEASKKSGLEGQRVLYAVKAAWLINSAIVEAKDARGTRKLGLIDETLWNLGRDFVSSITDLEDSALEAKYSEFLNKLLNNEQEPPTYGIIKLIVASRKITRPFLSRNETLLDHCMILTREYNSDSDIGHKVHHQGSVKLAIEESQKAVDAAVKCLPASGTFEIEQRVFQEAVEAYRVAQQKVIEALNEYKPTEAAALEQKMRAATQDDNDRIEELKGRCTSTSMTSRTKAGTIKITITDSPITPADREYPGDTKIGALIWEARLRAGNHIVGLMQDGKYLEAHQTIQTLDRAKELRFVLST